LTEGVGAESGVGVPLNFFGNGIPMGVPLNFFEEREFAVARTWAAKKYKTFHPHRDSV